LMTRSSKSNTVSCRMQCTRFMIERAIIMSRKSFFYHHGFVMWWTFLPTTRIMLHCSIGAFASSNTLEMKQSCRKHSFVDSRQSHGCRTLKKVEVNDAGRHSKGNEQQLQWKTDPFMSINDLERNRPQPRQ
jgi:hypothetical protein